jgi:hypothetical protein
MESLSAARFAYALFLALPLTACGPSDEADRAQAGPIVGPFVVSQFYTPSGFMGDGEIPGQLTVDINKNCKVPRPAGAQGDCYRFVYRPGTLHWAGAYWVSPANNWGTNPGRQLVGPVDLGVADPDKPGSPNLRGYRHMRASFAIEPLPGEVKFHLWAGKLDGREAKPPQPFWDTGCAISTSDPPTPPRCTDTNFDPPVPRFFDPAEKEPVALPTWQEYRFELNRWSVQELIAAFGFSTNDTGNETLTQVIYIDDIVWE